MTKAKYNPPLETFDMAKLVCADYGYDCEFVVEGEPDQVAEKFRIHTEEEHGIDYSKETLTKFMLDNNY